MSEMILSQSDFLAFIRGQAMANGNLSTRGVERCCGVANGSLFAGVDIRVKNLGQTLALHGFQPLDLAENGWPPQAVWSAIEYYALESRAKAPMAKQLLRTFGSIGIMAVLKELREPSAAQAPAIALPCHVIAVQKADAIRHITDTLDDNPRLAQVLIDSAINDIIEKALPSSQLRGVVEIAHEMGYKTDDSSRVKLGKFIKARSFEAHKESRLCNGVMTLINCYYDTPELRDAIADYFER
jgi:hypothetical protein